jgi:hypothetical protein
MSTIFVDAASKSTPEQANKKTIGTRKGRIPLSDVAVNVIENSRRVSKRKTKDQKEDKKLNLVGGLAILHADDGCKASTTGGFVRIDDMLTFADNKDSLKVQDENIDTSNSKSMPTEILSSIVEGLLTVTGIIYNIVSTP